MRKINSGADKPERTDHQLLLAYRKLPVHRQQELFR